MRNSRVVAIGENWKKKVSPPPPNTYSPMKKRKEIKGLMLEGLEKG